MTILENFQHNPREQNRETTDHVLHQITPQDRREAYQRQDNERQQTATNANLPTLEIVGALDRDRDGSLTDRELHAGANNPAALRIRGVAATIDHFSNNYEHPVTRQDIDQAAARGDLNKGPRRGENYNLFDARDGVTPNAVQQGVITDCVLMSGLASLATNERGRQFLRGMVQQDGDNFNVRFGNGQTVRTQRPNDTEFAIYAANSGHGIWPAVVERAFGTMMAPRRNMDASVPQEAASLLTATELFDNLVGPNGRRHAVRMSETNDDALHNQLTNTSPRAMLMIAGSSPNVEGVTLQRVDAQGRAHGTEPLSEKHSYAVDHYDSTSRSVFLRNPWHSEQLLRMPLQDFRRNFLTFDAVEP